MQPVDLTKMSLTELKAIGWDLVIQLEQTQNNLRVLNEEIRKKSAKPVEEIQS